MPSSLFDTVCLMISVINCNPYVEDINGLIKELNKTNDLFKFVRIMRAKFQAAALNGRDPLFILSLQSCFYSHLANKSLVLYFN